MKSKIRSLLFIIAFFATTIVFAEDKPSASVGSHHSVDVRSPMEIPKLLTLRLDVQITLFLADFFNLTWKPAEAKQDFLENSQQKN